MVKHDFNDSSVGGQRLLDHNHGTLIMSIDHLSVSDMILKLCAFRIWL